MIIGEEERMKRGDIMVQWREMGRKKRASGWNLDTRAAVMKKPSKPKEEESTKKGL